tara:strand:- start:4538 stop:5254 length:717 start_codon:yes stop_codon:yes gene_type:complete
MKIGISPTIPARVNLPGQESRGGGGAFEYTAIDNSFSMEFDGVDSYYDLGTSDVFFDSTQPFSCSAWCKVGSYAIASAPYPALFSFKTDQSTGFIMFLSHTGPYKGINFGSNNNFLRRLAGNQIDIPSNTWLHIVLTYDGVNRTSASSYKVYLNGTEKTQVNSDPFAACPNENNIGAGNGSNTRFNGKIDELATWSGVALSEETIQAIYDTTANNPGKIADLSETPEGAPTAWYRMGD